MVVGIEVPLERGLVVNFVAFSGVESGGVGRTIRGNVTTSGMLEVLIIGNNWSSFGLK